MHRAGHSSAVNQKSWQQGDTAEEDQAPDHHCSSSLKGALPFLLADPPLASAESAPTPGTSDFSDF